MNDSITAETSVPSSLASKARERNGLYLALGILLLVLVFVGFSPTFFLRRAFDGPVRSPYVFMHGVFMTAWYVLFVVQAALIYASRVRIHRELGVIAATIGYVAMLTAMFATWNIIQNPIPAPVLTVRSAIIWGNIGNIAVFTSLLTLAVYFRRNAHLHKHLMLFASISFVSPALGRIAGWPIAGGVDLATFNNSGILLLILAVIGYELWAERRVHLVTVLAGAGILVVRYTFGVLIAGSSFAIDFVRPVA